MTDTPLRRTSGATSIRAAMETIRPSRGRARQFWRVFDVSRIPMLVVDNDRRYVAANVAAKLVSRLSSEEFLIRRIDDLAPPRLRWTLLERWKRLMRDGAVFGPYDVGFPDGSELRILYCALANVLPGQHLIVFVPADWPGGELSVEEEPGRAPAHGALSPREREVLSLIAAGARSEQIADELMISFSTARSHTRNVLRKLHAHNRAHAVALAIRDGLIDGPGSSSERLASSG